MAVKYRSRRARIAALSTELRGQGQAWVQVAQRIAAEEHINMRVAFRLAHGLSQREVAAQWCKEFPGGSGAASMSDKVISSWESWPHSGYEPSLKSLKRLARLYQCNVGDLIDDGDYSHLDTVTQSAEISQDLTTIAPSAPRAEQAVWPGLGASYSIFCIADDDREDAMRRREFLVKLAALSGLGMADSGAALESIRHEINHSMIGPSATTGIDEWREIVLEYGHSYLVTPPGELLRTLVIDLHGLQSAKARYDNEDMAQRELCQIGAVLSAFTAQTVANLGYLREAQRWWRTARNSADGSSDRHTMLWVRGREIVRAGYERRSLAATMQLIDEAEARIDGGRPPVASLPEFLSGKAQTLALIGQVSSAEAEDTMCRLWRACDALPSSLTGGNADFSLFTWSEDKLRFTESFVYTYLGDSRRAGIAQDRALAVYPSDYARGSAQIELQRAICMVRPGDIRTGLDHARVILGDLPETDRIRPVTDLARRVLRAVPGSNSRRPEVRDYREYITDIIKAPTLSITS